MTTKVCLVAILSVLVLLTGCAGQSRQAASMQDLRALSYRVDFLERQQKQLNKQLQSASIEAVSPDGQEAKHEPVSVPANPWRRLKSDMTMNQVRRLLGEPTRVTQVYKGRVWWRYGSAGDGGKVDFDNGKVAAWSEPR